MKKLFFLISVTFFLIFLFLVSFENSFSQTINKAKVLLAENFSKEDKVFVVDSLALFTFVEHKENTLKIQAYFKDKGMPLYKQAETFVKVAEKYDLPIFLLPAISIKESTGGKGHVFRAYNPFGYGQKSFTSYEEAIEYVGYQLVYGTYFKNKNTIVKKLKTYNSVEKKYIPETLAYMKKMENQKIIPIDTTLYIDSFKIEKVRLEQILKVEENL